MPRLESSNDAIPNGSGASREFGAIQATLPGKSRTTVRGKQ